MSDIIPVALSDESARYAVDEALKRLDVLIGRVSWFAWALAGAVIFRLVAKPLSGLILALRGKKDN